MPRDSQSQDSIITTVLSLFCGVVCRDTPLAQFFGKQYIGKGAFEASVL